MGDHLGEKGRQIKRRWGKLKACGCPVDHTSNSENRVKNQKKKRDLPKRVVVGVKADTRFRGRIQNRRRRKTKEGKLKALFRNGKL